MKPRRMLVLFTLILIPLGTGSITWPGSLEPSAPPGPTMKTLDEIPPAWSLTISGAARFQIVMGGAAVLDKETGLVWERNPPPALVNDWGGLHYFCLDRLVGGRHGWRAPRAEELASLYQGAAAAPFLPAGHPFTMTAGKYWTQTSVQGLSNQMYTVDFSSNSFVVIPVIKSDSVGGYWCVRGGTGYDPK